MNILDAKSTAINVGITPILIEDSVSPNVLRGKFCAFLKETERYLKESIKFKQVKRFQIHIVIHDDKLLNI